MKQIISFDVTTLHKPDRLKPLIEDMRKYVDSMLAFGKQPCVKVTRSRFLDLREAANRTLNESQSLGDIYFRQYKIVSNDAPPNVQTPAARNSDPITSHIAARDITRSGVRSNQQRKALAAVKQWPGLTSFEQAMRSGFDRYALARRLSEISPTWVRRGEARRCTVTGRMAVTWWPVTETN